MRSVSRENAGYSKRQVQKHLGYIGAIFKVAKVYNPGTDLDKPRVKRGKVTFFYHSEVERIREHLGEQDSARVLVMSRIGLRRGEIVALRWMDVDFSGEQVHVRKNYVEGEEKDPKDHEVRSVPLQEDALQALAALSLRERFTDSSDLVFPRWDGCHQDPDGLSKRFRKAKQATGLDRGTLEHLRHTFATYALRHARRDPCRRAEVAWA